MDQQLGTEEGVAMPQQRDVTGGVAMAKQLGIQEGSAMLHHAHDNEDVRAQQAEVGEEVADDAFPFMPSPASTSLDQAFHSIRAVKRRTSATDEEDVLF